MRSLQLVNSLHLGLRLARRALLVRRVQLARSLPLVNSLHPALRLARRALLVPRLQLVLSLRFVNSLHPALRALLVRREKLLEVKNSLGCSELTETYCVAPLEV